jgi:integrase
MALFKVNTGLREKEVCRLKWDYEVKVPELDTSVFIIPGEQTKNGEERLVVLNRVAKSIIGSVRGLHPVDVFVRAHRKVGESRQVTKASHFRIFLGAIRSWYTPLWAFELVTSDGCEKHT